METPRRKRRDLRGAFWENVYLFCVKALFFNGNEIIVKRLTAVCENDFRIGRRVFDDFRQYVNATNEKAIEDLLQNYRIKHE